MNLNPVTLTVGQSCQLFTAMMSKANVSPWLDNHTMDNNSNKSNFVQKFFNLNGLVSHIANLNWFTVQNILNNSSNKTNFDIVVSCFMI